jgi:hypothetical protein
MSTRRFAVVVGFLVLCCFVYAQRRQTSSGNVPSGYQLMPAQVTLTSPAGPLDQHRVFLLDSTSGQVWEYYPEMLDKTGKYHGSSFQSVPVVNSAQ